MLQFDVLVVGSGGAGMRAALEAGRQDGLSVALIEKNDFCHATSSQTGRIVHAGFRYLQNMVR